MQTDVKAQPLSVEARQKALRTMMEIRATEERIMGLFLENLVRGTTHLCIGQEACSAGVAQVLQPGDTVTCTYRGHGHALAMGMSIKSLMAEMMGKVSGACGGKGHRFMRKVRCGDDDGVDFWIVANRVEVAGCFFDRPLLPPFVEQPLVGVAGCDKLAARIEANRRHVVIIADLPRAHDGNANRRSGRAYGHPTTGADCFRTTKHVR